MTDEEALKEIERQEKRFAAAGFGNGAGEGQAPTIQVRQAQARKN